MQSLALVSDHKGMPFFFPLLLVPRFARCLSPGCPFSSGFYLCHLSPLFCLRFLLPFLVSLSFPPCLNPSSLLFPDPSTLPPTTPGHTAVKSVTQLPTPSLPDSEPEPGPPAPQRMGAALASRCPAVWF